jgi:hypothetical protein
MEVRENNPDFKGRKDNVKGNNDYNQPDNTG